MLDHTQHSARVEALEHGNWDTGVVRGINLEPGGWTLTVAFGSDLVTTIHLPGHDVTPKLHDAVRVYIGSGARIVGVDLANQPVWFEDERPPFNRYEYKMHLVPPNEG